MSGADAQVARLLALAPYLRARPEGVPLRELAATFGVTPKQLVKDLKVLWFCGLPGYGPDDLVDINVESFEDDPDGVVKVTNSDFLHKPLRLDASEASALIVAVAALRSAAPAESVPLIDRVLAKLRGASGDEPAAVEVIPGPGTAAEIIALQQQLTTAIAQDRQVEIDHLVPHRDATTTRTVDPIAVTLHDGVGYLDGWCHRAGGRRTFRLDRIVGLRTTDAAREHGDLAPLDLSAGPFQAGPDAEPVTLLLTPRARWVAEYHPVEASREVADGCLEVDLLVADRRWLLKLVVGNAPDISVVAPADLLTQVGERATAALAAYPEGVE